jgi:hypothetical protein
MKNRKRILVLTLGLMLLVPGCGKKQEEVPATDTTAQEQVTDTTESAATDTTPAVTEEKDKPAEDTAQAEAPQEKEKILFAGDADAGYDFSDNLVRNNGSHFVQVEDTVIFREYGPEALDNCAFNGEFMQQGRSEPDYYYGQDSVLYSYNPKTDELKELCPDDGTGKLYYSDGWIWSDGSDEDWEFQQIYRIDPATGKRENLGRGYLDAMTESGLALAQHDGYTVDGDFTIFFDLVDSKGNATTLNLGDYKNAYYSGADGDYLIFMDQDYENATFSVLAVNSGNPEEVICLGAVEPREEGSFAYEWPVIDQVVTEGNMIYLVIGFYGGSGGFWQGGYIAQADAGNPGSLKKLTDDNIGDDDDGFEKSSSIWLEDGKLQIGSFIPESAEYSDYEGGILLADSTGTYQKTNISLCEVYPEKSAVSEKVEEIAYLCGGYFVVHNRILSDPTESVGWRESYHRLSTRYEFVKPDGNVKVLREVECRTIIQAHIALAANEDGLYFQPMRFVDEGDYEESYTFYLGELASDNVVLDYTEAMFEDDPVPRPLSELKNYEDLMVITDPGEFDWGGGYSVSSTGKDRLSEVGFILHFDKDGKIKLVFPDFAG